MSAKANAASNEIASAASVKVNGKAIVNAASAKVSGKEIVDAASAKVSGKEIADAASVKVSGKVVPGSYSRSNEGLTHHFTVQDIEHPDVTFPVEYSDVLPDTFTDEIEVVVEGRFEQSGVFQANTLLTKCGSRYEAAPEELRTHPQAIPAGEATE